MAVHLLFPLQIVKELEIIVHCICIFRKKVFFLENRNVIVKNDLVVRETCEWFIVLGSIFFCMINGNLAQMQQTSVEPVRFFKDIRNCKNIFLHSTTTIDATITIELYKREKQIDLNWILMRKLYLPHKIQVVRKTGLCHFVKLAQQSRDAKRKCRSLFQFHFAIFAEISWLVRCGLYLFCHSCFLKGQKLGCYS